jgi:hypothetical protein
MKIENGNNYLELEVSLENDDTLPSYGDAYIIITVNSNGFSGKNDLWVGAEELKEFCVSLVRLEKERNGEATLSSMSPGELNLKIYSIDSLGHLAVAGTTGYQVVDIPHSLTFGFEFDPSQLIKAVGLPWVKQNAA